jgi:hypothetical protein
VTSVAAAADLNREIEELRRKLHKELGSQYDPARLQALAPISQELDRLTVELSRRQMDDCRTELKS